MVLEPLKCSVMPIIRKATLSVSKGNPTGVNTDRSQMESIHKYFIQNWGDRPAGRDLCLASPKTWL